MKTEKTELSLQDSSETMVANEFSIVGIGASAGGLEPITKLLGNLPIQTGLSFVVIQHLATGQESLLPEILSRSTKMKVQQATDNMQIEKDQVYVIAPGSTLTLKDGCIRLLPKKPAFKPINDFFMSLASEKKTCAIGIVLSGTGNDGTEGLKAIKAEGGITFAQEPDTAQYPDMPKNAIAAGPPDFILSPEQIARELARIAKFPQHIGSGIKVPEEDKVETAFKKIIMLLKASFGVDFTHYRESTINRRITRRLVIAKTENLNEYVEYLRKYPNEKQALFDDLLIGVTSFFREPDTFLALKKKVFPELVQNKSSNESIRIWVPGCSSGEEVYSIAIAIQEFLEEKEQTEIRVQIFGTDANEKNIGKARQGIYPKSIEDKVAQNRLTRFFTPDNGHFRIIKFVRDMCIFAKQDITTDPPFSNVDLIICRNVLIYFDSHLHDRVLPIFHYGLKPNGFLVLGESESVGKFQYLFNPITPKGLIYKKKQAQLQAAFAEGNFVPHETKKIANPIAKADILIVLGEKVDRLIMSEYGPAILLVNGNLDILVFRGDVAPYLSPESGAASLNVTKIIRKELRSQVQTALYRARKENKFFNETVRFKQKGVPKTVKIEIKPLKTEEYEEPFYLVLFTELPLPESPSIQGTEASILPFEMENLKDRQIRELKEDLESTKEALQTVVEGQEATNEELHSSMEEVQSSNEELQSTNEELETAKEELQSGNEELQTLNEELKNRNLSLGRLNDDLTNLQMNIDLPVVIVDNYLKIRRFTTSAQSILKILPSDMGKPITNINIGIPSKDFENIISDVISKLTSVNLEIDLTRDGLFEMRIRPYLTEEKKIDGAVLSFADITQRKKVEEEMRKSDLILENSSDSIIVTDLQGKITSWNKGAAEIFGYSAKDIVGQSIIKLSKSEEKDKVALDQLESIRNGKVLAQEWEGVRKDGSSVWLILTTMLLKNNKNEPTGMVGFGKDVTTRKKVESALRESEQRYRTLFSNMEEGFFLGEPILDKNGNPSDFRILEANSAFEKQTGLKLKDLLGKTIKEALPGLEEIWVQTYCKVALTGDPIHFENYNINTHRYFDVYSFRPTKERFASLFIDITERIKLQNKLKEYSENLEKLVEERTRQLKDSERLAAIGATAGMVGHDIRNPLQAITCDLYLAKTDLASIPESDMKKGVLESLQEIEKNTDYINKIVADLQDFARPLKANPEEIDFKIIIDELFKKNGIPDNVRLRIKLKPEARKVVVDYTFINRIMQNLVNNAVQAMPNGGLLTINTFKEENDFVITVQDTGVGIPEKLKGKMFMPMFTTKAKGQGFGLAVIKRMTDASGGTVTFESQEGKGTTFKVRLPY